MKKTKDLGGVSEEAKLKNYVVYAPPVFGKLTDFLPKYPMPGESYNYKQMVDVIAIFDKRWKAAGASPDREPFAVSASKDGIDDKDPHKFTRDLIYSSVASDAYLEAVSDPESAKSGSNSLLSELLSLDWSDDDADDFEGTNETVDNNDEDEPQGGGKKCPKRKETPKKTRRKKKSAK